MTQTLISFLGRKVSTITVLTSLIAVHYLPHSSLCITWFNVMFCEFRILAIELSVADSQIISGAFLCCYMRRSFKYDHKKFKIANILLHAWLAQLSTEKNNPFYLAHRCVRMPQAHIEAVRPVGGFVASTPTDQWNHLFRPRMSWPIMNGWCNSFTVPITLGLIRNTTTFPRCWCSVNHHTFILCEVQMQCRYYALHVS